MLLFRLANPSLSKARGIVTCFQFRGLATAQITSHNELSTIVKQFPSQIDYAFGYGSAVLRQQNLNPSSSMVDIIMAVSDPYQWHVDNLLRHQHHYSVMSRLGGPSFVTWLQTNFGAKLYFHPYVDLDMNGSSEARQIKYGVVSTSDLVSDLLDWDHLYLAGRMHKPICQIETTEDEEDDGGSKSIEETKQAIDDAQCVNLLAAVSCSLLLLGGNPRQSSTTTLTTSDLYTTIASLSYTGDFRMQTGAEDPNKINKLVETPGMLDLWETKYADTINSLREIGLLSMTPGYVEKNIELNTSDVQTRKQLMTYLPARLQAYSDLIIGLHGQNDIHQGSLVLKDQLANIVAPAARNQGIKGVITAGPLKSWKYASAKFAKGRFKT